MSQDLGPQPGPAWSAQQSWPPQPGPWLAQPAPNYIPAYPAGPPAPKGKRFRTGIIVGIVAGIAVAILGAVGLGIGALLIFNSNAPASLGDDPRMDRLYAECSDGAMASCDTLFNDSAFGSELEEFGATCGARLEEWSVDSCTTLDL